MWADWSARLLLAHDWGLLWAFLSTFGFEQDDIIAILAALAGLRAVPYLYKRLLTLVATYPLSLTFKFASQILPKYTIEEAEFFTCDGASPEVAERRKNSIKELSEKWKKKYPKCQEFSVELKKMISDLRFTSARRRSEEKLTHSWGVQFFVGARPWKSF